jgi:hypothetical protein
MRVCAVYGKFSNCNKKKKVPVNLFTEDFVVVLKPRIELIIFTLFLLKYYCKSKIKFLYQTLNSYYSRFWYHSC